MHFSKALALMQVNFQIGSFGFPEIFLQLPALTRDSAGSATLC
jgi:hypothetical protein